MFVTHNWLIKIVNFQVLTVINVNLLHVCIYRGLKSISGSAATGGTIVRYFVGVSSRKHFYIRLQNTHFMRNLKNRFILSDDLCCYVSDILRIFFSTMERYLKRYGLVHRQGSFLGVLLVNSLASLPHWC